MLGSRLQGCNLLTSDTNISIYRSRETNLAQFFSSSGDLVYCTDIPALMDSLGYDYLTEDWRLFIDSSKVSLTGKLLHNGNRYPSIPIAHAIHMKETYGNMQNLLEKIDYKKYAWNICGNLKVIALLLGLQLGYTKFCCFGKGFL